MSHTINDIFLYFFFALILSTLFSFILLLVLLDIDWPINWSNVITYKIRRKKILSFNRKLFGGYQPIVKHEKVLRLASGTVACLQTRVFKETRFVLATTMRWMSKTLTRTYVLSFISAIPSVPLDCSCRGRHKGVASLSLRPVSLLTCDFWCTFYYLQLHLHGKTEFLIPVRSFYV